MIVFRYLAKQVLLTMTGVSLVLLLVFMSGRFIKYLAKAASGGISPDVLFSIMGYRLPGFLELILPLAFFIGILLAYGRMYLESEMTVLHACGLSVNKLMWMTLALSAGVALFVGAMSLVLSPWGMQKVEAIFVQQSKMTEFEMLVPGKFHSLRSGERVTYTGELSSDKKTMHDVFIAMPANERDGLDLVYANTGTQRIDETSGHRFLILHDGKRYTGVPGELAYQVVSFESYGVEIQQPDAEQRSAKEEAIPTRVLLDSERPEYSALLQWRLSLPFIVPVVTLLALSLCRVNPRQGRFFHLFPAMLIYIAYLGLLIVSRKKVASGEVSEWFGLWVVHVAFFLLAILLMKRQSMMDFLGRLLESKRGGVNASS